MSYIQEYDYLFKLLLVGNSSVGKSSILLRFSDNVFNDDFQPTIGVDFKIRTLDLEKTTVKMQIWDTAGQERFKTITASYYKGAHGVIIVYDITDRQSFVDLEGWLQEVEKNTTDENVVRLLIGNKCDLESSRKVSKEEGQRFAESNGMKFIETSARNAVNIEEAFQTMAQEIKNYYIKQGIISEHSSKRNRTLGDTDAIDTEGKKKSCC